MREEEHEDMERGSGQWVHVDGTGEDITADEMLGDEDINILYLLVDRLEKLPIISKSF